MYSTPEELLFGVPLHSLWQEFSWDTICDAGAAAILLLIRATTRGAPLSLLNPYMYSNLQELSFVVWHSPVLSVIRIFLKYLMLWRRPFCFDQCCYQGALLSLFTTYMYSTLQELSFGILHTPVSHVIRICLKYLMLPRRPFCFEPYGHQGAESPRWIRFLEAPYPYLSLCQIPEFFYFLQSCYAHWGFPGQLKAQNCATTSLWGRANLARFDSTWRKKYKCYDKSDGSSEMLTKFLIRL